METARCLARGTPGLTTPPYGRYVEDITVEHLLTHTAGGWQNDGSNPMFSFQSRDGSPPPDPWTLAKLPLQNPPGEHYAYSNFGYCILGKTVAKLDRRARRRCPGESLSRCGISNMRLAGNTRAERAFREVVYYRNYRALRHECQAYGFPRRLARLGNRFNKIIWST